MKPVNLRTPGPTPIPDEALQASAKPMMNHRGPEYAEIINRVTEGAKKVFATEGDVLLLTTSGTGGLEAAVVNTLSPGDKVLAVIVGVFGDRFAQIATTYGAEVVRLDFPWGTAADPEEVRRALHKDPSISAVMVTHNETSTGVTNDLEALARVIKGEFGKLLLVDGVSSVSSIPIQTDAWGCDVVASASQKGWMAPPGIAPITMSQAAWQAYERSRMPRFYFDLGKAKSYLARSQNPWTPVLPVMYALDVSLQRMLQEGLEQVYQRHARIGQFTRDGVKALGLELFADERHASNTVTAVKVPEGVDGKALVSRLRTEHGVVVAGGQQKLEGQIIRIGHMGYVEEEHIREALQALAACLSQMGYRPSGTGVRSA